MTRHLEYVEPVSRHDARIQTGGFGPVGRGYSYLAWLLALVAGIFVMGQSALAEPRTIVVDDPQDAAARVGAPVSVAVDLADLFGENVEAAALEMVEAGAEGKPGGGRVAVQFVPEEPRALRGQLWWLMPPGPAGQRQFRLLRTDKATLPKLTVQVDRQRKLVDVSDGSLSVLRYNQGTVPPPPEIVQRYEKKENPPLYYARGDYIHPICGPDGEPLTDDYSLDHPHHRGLCWAWPVVRWKGEVRDIWAVCILPPAKGGVWARPVSMKQAEAGPVLAAIRAENVWKWGDNDPIVREEVAIHAFRAQKRCRYLDVEVRLTALVDDLSIGGRPHASYGGLTFRTFPQFDGRKIDMHVDKAEAKPRRAWFHLTGNFPGGKGLAGVALLESVANPDYPSYPRTKADNPDHVPGEYPRWRSMQPAWPGDREVPLAKGKPLVLKHRLWIHPGLSDEATLTDVWTAYAEPAKVRVEK